MATSAQIQANRKNAQKSTGPKTPEGKAVVAQNALRHGLRSNRILITSEDVDEYETHRNTLLDELAPRGRMETILAERIVKLTWQLNRSDRLQTCMLNTLIDEKNDQAMEEDTLKPMDSITEKTQLLEYLGLDIDQYYDLLEKKGYEKMGIWVEKQIHKRQLEEFFSVDPQTRSDRNLGRVTYDDFSQSRTLERISMYERRIENSLYKTHLRLERLQNHRKANQQKNPECTDIKK